MLLLVLLVVAAVWLVAALAVAGLCRAAALGDSAELVPSLDWDDLRLSA
jgi:hypothetical protein